jgi:hypothetical protein
MNSASLRRDQVERIAAVVRRMRCYLDSLAGRCHQKHFPYQDPLKVAADEAAEAIKKLDAVMAHLADEHADR